MELNNSKKVVHLHKSVLLEEFKKFFSINKDIKNIIVDATLGMGGHAKEVLRKLKKGDIFIGFDSDIRNLDIAKPQLEEQFAKTGINLIFINDNFINVKERLLELGLKKITGIYYDLGISSLHVDDKERGFSFKLDGPLDMRFNTFKGIPASKVINSYKKHELIKIFKEYGEEPFSRKIAEEIINQRNKGVRFQNTLELSELINKISRNPKSKTRIFQSLRIEVNKELDVIKKSVNDSIDLLTEGGLVFVISFHSLEDRIIKNIFKKYSRDFYNEYSGELINKKRLEIITKKPIIPTKEEILKNPRSRSAKARCAKKI